MSTFPGDHAHRQLGSLAMIALGLIGAFLVIQMRLTQSRAPSQLVADQGPFHASIATDGSLRLGAPAPAIQPGQTFGWTSEVCAAAHTRIVLQTRLVRLADNQVLLYRERALPAETGGCVRESWDLTVPPDALPGAYHLQRYLLLTPAAGPPASQTLPSLAVTVTP